MPNITTVLNEQIRRIAKNELKKEADVIRRATVQFRHDIAELKRQVLSLSKIVLSLEKQGPRAVERPAAQEMPEEMHFRADGLRSHRKRLGISGKAYGVLVGVTGQTIYDWESGQSRPRKQQLARLAAARQIGKREAMERVLPAEKSKPAPANKAAVTPTQRSSSRGRFDQTAEQFLTALIKNKKVMDNTQISAAWKASGRGSSADNTLSKMVQGGILKREKIVNGRGSRYSLN